MSDKHLNIVSFDVPFPPNYGGVIDVYYKLKHLAGLGVKIHLHCFVKEKNEAKELENFCESVNYYPRKVGLSSLLSRTPYVVRSRNSKQLLKNLCSNDYPVMFEGLHTCGLLEHPSLSKRHKMVRMANIEHEYYRKLSEAESNLLRKTYLRLESIKLKGFEKVLHSAQHILAISYNDEKYLKKHFGKDKVTFLPAFHENEEVSSLSGKGKYILYHGNLAVPENFLAASFIIRQFKGSSLPLKIAGLNPPGKLRKLVGKAQNIELIVNPDAQTMQQLIREAHVNLLITFQQTGVKLKLINVLFKGRFCVSNNEMTSGTGLKSLCYEPDDLKDLKKLAVHLFEKQLSGEEIAERKKIMDEKFNNIKNAGKLLGLIHEV